MGGFRDLVLLSEFLQQVFNARDYFFVDSDVEHKLGFIGFGKRFNVAITRAQALLIVVGDPDILKCDYNWRQFLIHCAKKNACVGTLIEGDWANDEADFSNTDDDDDGSSNCSINSESFESVSHPQDVSGASIDLCGEFELITLEGNESSSDSANGEKFELV